MRFDWIKAAAWIGTALIGLAFWLLFGIAVASCARSTPTPAPGTAQASAAGAQARVEAAAIASDAAGGDAARLAGEAAAATARATATGRQEDIAAAVDARVRAAAAQAVHTALLQQETSARTAATAAAKLAADERTAEQAAQDYRSWVRLCRWVGGAAIVGGFLIAAVLAWATKNPRAGLWPGGILSSAGALVVALGPATAWLPWLVAVAVTIAVIWWAAGHRLERIAKERAAAAALAGSRAVDAIEREIGPKAKDAKRALGTAINAAGLADLVEQRRGTARDWTTKDQG
jgi:hypothetical protein